MEQSEQQIQIYDDKEYEVAENMIVQGKDKRRLLIWLNVWSFLIIIAVFAAGLALIALLPGDILLNFGWLQLLFVFIAFFVYIPIHELLHGLAFRFFGGITWKHIAYGVVVKSGMAYCIAEVPVHLPASRISLLAPFVLVCVPLFVIGVWQANLTIIFAAALFSSGSVGDFWYLIKLRGKDRRLMMIEDKPQNGMYQLGCLLVRPMG